MIKKILIANRGEIACRIIKTAKKLKIKTVSIYSDSDINAEHVKVSDESYYLGPSEASKSYLNISKIIEICKKAEVDAVHPGYGFLSENPNFVRELTKNKIIFIGPSENAIISMGDKIKSKMIAEKAGYKRTALELGGNDPLIILNDLQGSDFDKAATIAVAGATGNSGQRCTAVKRILIQESIADEVVPLILEKAQAIKFGDPMDPDTQLGCVINAQAAELFEKRVFEAEAKGAKILYHPGRDGALLPPIVIDHVPHECDLVMEETFGPIVSLISFSEEDSFDKDHEISQFFHFQVSDLFKDTMNMLLIKL